MFSRTMIQGTLTRKGKGFDRSEFGCFSRLPHAGRPFRMYCVAAPAAEPDDVQELITTKVVDVQVDKGLYRFATSTGSKYELKLNFSGRRA